jgi:hypothetical protein
VRKEGREIYKGGRGRDMTNEKREREKEEVRGKREEWEKREAVTRGR